MLAHSFYTLVLSLMIYNLIYHDLKMSNLVQICKNGIMIFAYFIITLQIIILIYHKNSLYKLIEYLKRYYNLATKLTVEERMIIEKYANQGVYVCRQWVIIAIMGFSSFLIKSIILMIYYYWIDSFTLVPYYDLLYPAVFDNIRDNIFVFLTVYTGMMIFAFYTVQMHIAYIPLGPIFMLHACGQLEVIQNKIDFLFEEHDDALIKEKLKDIIQHLQYVYKFALVITDIFKIGYDCLQKVATIAVPVTLYKIIEAANHGELSLEFIVFIVGSILVIYSAFYYSDLLQEKAEAVRLSLYTCGWENHYNRFTQTTLLILLQKALRPIAIRTVFRAMTLDALTDIFQQSYAIFNLMNAIWD